MCCNNNRYHVVFYGDMYMRPYYTNSLCGGMSLFNRCGCRCNYGSNYYGNNGCGGYVPYNAMDARYCMTGNGYGMANSQVRERRTWCSDCY